jgi:predicted ferric reductase
MITSRVSRLWPGGPEAVAVHQFVSILALAMAAFHALILLGDRSMAYSGLELLVPFASGRYRRWWVGLGQLGGYLAAVVVLSFYVRRVIGARAWRLIHYSSFALYLLVLAHGIGAGTDASAVPMIGLYALTGLIVYVLTVYRLLVLARSRRQVA